MTPCPHCNGLAFEHVTVDERIFYCGQCGWEDRRRCAGPRRARTKPVAPARHQQQRRR